MFGTQEYLDGVTISTEEFYEKLANAEELPTTSQPSPEEFLTHFEQCKQEGESVIVITISSKLSGTYQSAVIAKDMCEYEDIHIIDSATATIGLYCLVEYAIRLNHQGLPVDKIVSLIDEMKQRVRIYALVDTLKYLKKGGRLSATAALAGTLLNIKPIVEVKDGVVDVAGKARGTNGAIKKVVELVEEAGGIDPSMPSCIGYTGKLSVVEDFSKYVKDIYKTITFPTAAMGSTIGVHAGPGACVVAFFAKK
jgi:DegV family protein with EDD domain